MHNGYKYFLGLAIDEEVPDDTTISYFRAQRLGEEKFRQVFEQIVKQCMDKGLVKGKRQIIDSTHIIADMAIMSLTGLVKLCRQNVLKTIEKQDSKIAEKLGLKDLKVIKQDKFSRKEDNLEEEIEQAEKLLDGITQELKEKNLMVTPELQKDLGLLEKSVADREDGAIDRLVSPVDPAARAGKKTSKRWSGYKGHLLTEEETEIITAVETTPANQDDGSQLPVLLKQEQEAVALKPDELSGDKAYGSGANLEILDSEHITGYISLIEKRNPGGPDLFTVDDFTYDPIKDTLACPAGHLASYHRRAVFNNEEQKKRGSVFQFKPEQCNTCEFKPLCNNSKKGRAVYISYYDPFYKEMKERLATEEGKSVYKNRYKIEHKVADLARYCGMRRCRYRGLVRAKIHTLLAAIASNVKRMARLLCPSIGEVCPKENKPPEVLAVAS